MCSPRFLHIYIYIYIYIYGGAYSQRNRVSESGRFIGIKICLKRYTRMLGTCERIIVVRNGVDEIISNRR